MPSRPTIEQKLSRIRQLAESADAPTALAELRKALGGAKSILVEKAAEVAGRLEAESLTDALEAAFDRFTRDPVRTDKGCRAKTAIVEALYKIGAAGEDVFARGIHWVQMEPSFGPPVDTAARLRGLCGMALVRMRHPDAMNELARLLADAEPDARIMAARAIAYSGDPSGEPLLRYKVLRGDSHGQVQTECFLALLKLAPEASLDFVAGFLDGDNRELAEAAIAALGESHDPRALAPLTGAYEGTLDAAARGAILLAVAELRCEQGIEFLIERLADSTGKTAQAVLAALASYRFDPAIRQKVAAVVDQLRDRELAQAFNASFNT